MHPKIFREFDKMVRKYNVRGKVLEIGAIPNENTLLMLPSLAGTDRIGLNLEGGAVGNIEIIKANANQMPFPDNHFNCVLCNATLEHDMYFWKTCDEMKRVTKDKGLIILGVPGFTRFPYGTAYKTYRCMSEMPKMKSLAQRIYNKMPIPGVIKYSTLTYIIHSAPDDFWRFSASSVEKVLLANCSNIEVRKLMMPPRLIGIGQVIKHH